MDKLITILLNLLDKALNWASPFFLGKTLQARKDEKASLEAINEAETSRKNTHRSVVNGSDADAARDQLRQWARSEDTNPKR